MNMCKIITKFLTEVNIKSSQYTKKIISTHNSNLTAILAQVGISGNPFSCLLHPALHF
jgi:hypothetical protein